MTLQELKDYAESRYGTSPQYLWGDLPDTFVLRHGTDGKWFAVVMPVLRRKLGLEGEGEVLMVDVKCDPMLAGDFCTRPGVMRPWHMNKLHWLGILPDQADRQTVEELLEISYTLTMPKKRRRQE